MKPGDSLGPYQVLAAIGSGGMGKVFRARDPRLDRDIAIKVLHDHATDLPERRERFTREARAVAALTHPNIVAIHSVEEADGRLFLTMEYVEGRTLTDVIPKGGMSLDRIFDLAIPLADAVAAAHEKGIIHRDLKPSNVMVSDDGRVKVLDFGLAKLKTMGQSSDSVTIAPAPITTEGLVVGTVAYMSPEQAEGAPLDQRTDLFSLGVILYEMATGRRPFAGDTSASLIAAILRDMPPSVTDANAALPAEFARIVRRCLAKDPSRRYQTAIDVRNELEDLKRETDAGRSSAAVPSAVPRPRRTGWVVPALGVAAAVVGVTLFLLLRQTGTPPLPPPELNERSSRAAISPVARGRRSSPGPASAALRGARTTALCS